ncbi:MAG: ABC transporter ATP-binding protein [Anaerolineales bacterium]|nr:ABC transporter ATP-binding protein [Anaerolineales bacterium]
MTDTNDYVLKVEDLTMHYTTRSGEVSAVNNVTFALKRGQSMGLVGESGCGKTSIAFSLLKLLPENARIKGGRILLNGADLVPLKENEMRKIRWRHISMVFQAAMNALNPVYKVGEQIVEAMETHGQVETISAAREHIANLFSLVGLDPKLMDQYPHEYSGGMRQRAVIAMALACSPDLIIADEPTTALDVIVQDALLREMIELQKKLNMSMIYISHDVAVIAEVTERIGVMYAGRMAEFGTSEEIFKQPLHPYTYGLMSAFPSIVGPKRELTTLPGEPPDLISPPPGCRFHPRCPYATEICSQETPEFKSFGGDHYAACWHPMEGN